MGYLQPPCNHTNVDMSIIHWDENTAQLGHAATLENKQPATKCKVVTAIQHIVKGELCQKNSSPIAISHDCNHIALVIAIRLSIKVELQ